MDDVKKNLRKLSPKEYKAMRLLIAQIKHDYRKVPHVKPLQGMKGWFRVRMGRYRIVFTVDPVTNLVNIEKVGNRNEQTYKNL